MSVDALYRSTPTAADGRPPARHYSERTANEQSQLDDILQDLLTDPLFVNNARGFEWSNSADGTYGSISPHQGSITTHSGHGGRTVVSWQTSQNAGVAGGSGRRSVDRPSPDAVFETETSRRVETSSASRRPGSADERSTTTGGRYESRRVETRTEASTTRREGTTSTGATESSSSSSRRGQPPPPPVRRRMFSPEMFNHESAAPTSRPAPIRREPEIAPTTASTTKTQPSRGQNFSPTSYNRNYSSDTEEPGQSSSSSKWLEEQRGKLQSSRQQQQQRGSRPGPGSAAAQSDTEDYYFRSSSTDRRGAGGRGGNNDFSPSTSRRRPYAFDDPYLSDSGYEVASRRPQQYASQTIQPTPHNRSADTRAYDLESGRLFETKRTFFVSGIERPPRCNSAQQTKYTFSVSPQRSLAGDEFPVSRPPPTQRPITPSRSCTSPVLPPLRTDSSREAVMRVHAVKEAPPAPPPRQARDTHSPSLDDLEKSLKDVHVLLQAPPPPRPAPSPTIDDLVTANKLKPEEADIEEEVIQLKPIGPGVQNLEVEGHTRHRSVTPGFPMEPVTPPFPASHHATSMHQGYSSVNDVRSATLPPAQPAPPSDLGKYMDEFNRLTESDTLTKSQLSGPSHMKQPAQAPPPQPAPEDLGRLLEEFNTLTEVNTLQKSPPMAPIQQQVSAMTNAAPSGNFVVGSSGPRVEETSTLTRQTVVMQQAAAPMTSYAANDADMHIYQTPRRQYPQQQIQPQAQLQQQQFASGSSQNFGSDSLLRNQNISTMQRQQQFVTEQRQATLPYQQQHQYHITEQQGTVAPASFQLQQPAVQAASYQQSYATNYQSPPANTLQRQQQQQQQQFQETFSQQGMQHGQMTGTGMSGLQQADGMRFSQQDVHSGMAGQHGLRGTEQQRVQSSTVQYATVTGGPHRGRTMSEGHWQQQQQNGQHPAVVEDFNASRVNQNYAQKASTLMAQRSTSLVEGRQDASGSGLLTVTTRAFSPSTLAAPLSASSGRISPGDMTLQARLQSRLNTRSPGMATMAGRASPTVYFGQSRTGSLNSLQDGGEVLQNSPRFVRDSSKFWHKPHITREEAITMLKDKPAGSFVVRNSNTFQGAFGLAVKVSQLPPNVHIKEGVDPQTELVRHFLIEPTSRGVRLKGCSNEPVFGSLAALVYQHTVTPLALPCKLLLPDVDVSEIDAVDAGTTNAANKSLLYVQGAACNVLYINSVDMESLTGPEALSRAINMTFLSSGTPPQATDVHFKVSSEGITLTDNKHRLFFRRHYPINTITFCGVDAKDRRWTVKTDDSQTADCKVFGFVARKSGVANDNACHVFAEIDPNQPANAIVNFLTKVMIGQGHFMKT